MDIEAAIIKARELLEEIPGVDSILGAWDVYCAHMDGPWVNVGPYLEDGYNSPNPQYQQIALKMLVDIYNRLAPFEDRIISLFNILDFAHLGYKDEMVRHNLACLKIYCNDFHSNQITMMALGLLDGQGKTDKQPRIRKQTKTIKDYILLQDEKQKDEFLSVLHPLLDDKKGKMTALVILVCVDMGLMEKPPHGALKQEFEIKGDKSGHNTYVAGGLKGYTKEEINGIKTRLEQFKIAINSQD